MQNPRPVEARQTIRVVGLDPSLRNWGVAIGTYSLETKQLTLEQLMLTKTDPTKGKQVRQNSLDLECSLQLYQGAMAAVQGAHAVFVEVPVGSQSARAAASYGICVGVLGAMRANGVAFFEVTPNEVKLAAVGHKKATKQEMIDWAVAKHPEASWPGYRRNGTTEISATKAEHMADAVAAIYAGLSCKPFQQLLPLLSAAQLQEREPCKFN